MRLKANDRIQKILIFSVVIIGIFMTSHSAIAQNTLTFPDVQVKQNETSVFGLDLTNQNAIASVQITFIYDSTIGFTITGKKLTARTANFDAPIFQIDDNDLKNVGVTVILYSMSGATISPESGNILEFAYQTTSDGYGSTSLAFTESILSDANGASHPVMPQNGSISFEGITYTLTKIVSPPTCGTITVSPDKTSYDSGESVTITANTTDSCCAFTGWSGDCTGTDTTCNLKMNSDKSVKANFKIKTWSLIGNAGTGGSISPSSASVNCGEDKTFAIKPNTGYIVNKFTDNGTDKISSLVNNQYSLINIQEDHAIAVAFKSQPPHTITTSIGNGGTISPSGNISVESGANQTFTITSNPCYQIKDVKADGVSKGAVSSYIFQNVIENHTISAEFTVKSYALTVSAGNNGTISPSGPVSADCGTDKTFTITSNTGYVIDKFTDNSTDKTSLLVNNQYNLINIQEEHTIAVTFKVPPTVTYTITASAGNGGTISPSGNVSVKIGANQSFIITPNSCYKIKNVKVDGVSKGSLSSYTFQAVSSNHTITAEFEISSYALTATSGTGGRILPSSAIVNCGGNKTFTITPDTDYCVNTFTDNGIDKKSALVNNQYSLSNIKEEHNLFVSFLTCLCTYTISGYVRDSSNTGINGITLAFSNNGGSVTTNPSGYYTQTVHCNWSGTVTPSKTGYTFNPAYKTYTNLTSHQTQNYTAIPKESYLQVILTPLYAINAGAQWSINGGSTWYDSGDKLELDPGNYTVEFKSVSGWNEPYNQNAAIIQGETRIITGTYSYPCECYLHVTITPQEAIDEGAQWRIADEGIWHNSSDVIDFQPGTHTIEFKPITGWSKPENQIVKGTDKQTTTINAVYQACEPHFMPVWTEPSDDSMTLLVLNARIEGKDLSACDEIGIFDGEKCVGVGVLQDTISADDTLMIVASQDDGTGNGFTPGNPVLFRYWDVSEQKEITEVTPFFTNLMTEKPIDPPGFKGSAFGVSLKSGPFLVIPLSNGWNMISSHVIPENPDMLEIVRPLADAGVLEKVIDEKGNRIIRFFGNWINNIGDISHEEGYKIKVSRDIVLVIDGKPAPLPTDIFLSGGWNLMGYPCATPQDALKVFQPLIDAGVLEKVIDEKGNRLIKFFGEWMNKIVDLEPGEGYMVKTNSDAWLTINEPPKDLRGFQNPAGLVKEFSKPRRSVDAHFTPIWTGKPFEPMNLWIVGVGSSLRLEPTDLRLEPTIASNDEIGVFDGETCVGVGIVGNEISEQNSLVIITSKDDDEGNGFVEGNPISFRIWDSDNATELSATPEFVDMEQNPIAPPTFAGNADYAVRLTNLVQASDLNQQPVFTLNHVITVLKILGGMNIIPSDADADGNGKTEMADAVYILQKITGMRE